MIDGKWEDWTEPIHHLIVATSEFLTTVKQTSSLVDMPKRGKIVVGPKLHTRKEELAKALNAFLTWQERKMIWAAKDFLKDYVYVSSVYEDVYSFIFEYIGENEHQMDLHGDEFAQTKKALIKDFALYVENWQSPYWRSLE